MVPLENAKTHTRHPGRKHEQSTLDKQTISHRNDRIIGIKSWKLLVSLLIDYSMKISLFAKTQCHRTDIKPWFGIDSKPVPRASFLDRESVGLSFGEPARRTPVTPSGSLPEEHPATTGRSQMELTSKWELTSPKSPPTSSSPPHVRHPFSALKQPERVIAPSPHKFLKLGGNKAKNGKAV
ncbi:uncharacterized protein ACOB7L_026101 isoform 2-T2 [Callospermophilus lateralis]|uniref:uncharacterized protein LOC143411545 isoform X2 n=1 Tax=Callospermophilus lateralis TaxID=76772 RepID=UPI0040387ABE